LQPVREFFEAQQQQVIGASLSGKVAKALQTETGIPSSTIASLAWRISNERMQLTDKHVLVIDEAGMVDVHNMAFLIREAKKAGSKVVLIGDPDQLKPIHKGEIFRGIASLTGYIELENIKRQQDAGDRQASFNLAKGHIDKALQHYNDKGAVFIDETQTGAIDHLINDWQRDITQETLKDSILLSFTRATVAELNDKARAVLKDKQLLDKDEFIYKGYEQKLTISAGERLLFRQNDATLGVRNGDIGTVKAVSKTQFKVQLDSGETRGIPRTYQAIDYGYALTVHKSQGMTAEHARVLIDSKYWDRNLSYVAMTRHKQSLKIYGDKINHPTLSSLETTLSRRTHKSNVMDWPVDFAVRHGFEPDKSIERLLNNTSQARGDESVSEIDIIKHLSPIIVKYELLLKKRQKQTGYFAEKTDKKILITIREITSNAKLMGKIKEKTPIFARSLDRKLHCSFKKDIELER